MKRIYLLAEVLPSKQEEFRNEYAKRTQVTPIDKEGFFARKPGKTAWGCAYRVFFEPKVDWVNDSFEKMGFHVTSNNVFCPYDEGIKFPFLVSSEELFWWLVDYGYRLGENEPIDFKDYEESLNKVDNGNDSD